MTERCYLATSDVQKVSQAVSSELGYENITVHDDWGRTVGQGKQYYRDCPSGCCWYVSDFCCTFSASDLLTRVVAVIVTLLLVTAVIIIVLCGGTIFARRRGQRLTWPRRPGQQSCLIPDLHTATSAGLHQQPQQRFVHGERARALAPPPYEPRNARAAEEGRGCSAIGQYGVTVPKPPDYNLSPAQADVAMTTSRAPPPTYSENSLPSDAREGGSLTEPPPTYVAVTTLLSAHPPTYLENSSPSDARNNESLTEPPPAYDQVIRPPSRPASFYCLFSVSSSSPFQQPQNHLR